MGDAVVSGHAVDTLDMRHFEELRRMIHIRLHELEAPYVDLQIDRYPWLYGALGEVPSATMFICENPSLSGMRGAAVNTIDGRPPDIEAQWWGGWSNPAAKRFRVALRRMGLKINSIAARGGWKCYITNVVKEANIAGADQDALTVRQRNAQACDWADILAWELDVVRPERVFCVGHDALAAVRHLHSRRLIPRFRPRYPTHYSARGSEDQVISKMLEELRAGMARIGSAAGSAKPASPPTPSWDSELARLKLMGKQRGVVMPSVVKADELRRILAELPPPITSRSRYSGKRIVRAREYQNGGNPRQEGSHGYNAYDLIPNGDFGVLFEDLMARVRQLPAKSSRTYGAGGANHIKWDLDHGFTYLIEDQQLPLPDNV